MNWYATREAFKRALKLTGSDSDSVIDRHIAGTSRALEKKLGLALSSSGDRARLGYIPRTETRQYRWPPRYRRLNGYTLELDAPLLSVSALKTNNQADDIASDDYFLEPINEGPPYWSIEIDQGDDVATASVLTYDDSPQRAISVAGDWGLSETTEAAGALAAAISDTTGTEVDITDASLVGVGHTLLIGSERMFVSEKSPLDTTANLNGDLTASGTTVTVTDGSLVNAGEVISLESERMYVRSVSGNDLTVIRAYDGTTAAAHTGAVDVYAFRRLTVVRGVNGSTAATHSSAAPISRYAIDENVEQLVLGEAIFVYKQEEGGHTGIIPFAEEGVAARPAGLMALWAQVKAGDKEYAIA